LSVSLEKLPRKSAIFVETLHHDGGPAVAPVRRGAIAVVLGNPHAGCFEPDLLPWMESLRPLAVEMSHQLLGALNARPADIETFGKGAIVGVDGELEHAAVWHAPGGHGMKSVLGVKGFVTAGQIMGAVGARLHVPLVNVHSPWVRSHFDAIDIMIADAPRPREIVFVLAMGTGGRVHERLGGLTAQQAAAGEGPGF
jgi:hypothetical protein